jgi:class 3 adenylate cyclase
VKTIGDAVMASFSDPLQAIRAGLAMQKAFQQWADSLQLEYPPGLRVGIHFGPALVVHTDQAGLDYFGGTVNLAARTEGQARPGEVVWTRALHETAGVAEALEADGLPMEAFTTTVKGIEQPVELVRCRP